MGNKVKLIIVVVLLVVLSIVIIKFNEKEEILESSVLDDIEESYFNIDRYVVFGTHLNLEGCIDDKLDNDIKLVLKSNSSEIELDSQFYTNDDNNTCFKTSDKNNTGIYLDSLKLGKYYLLIKQSDEENTKYYSVKNNTEYNDIEYYTITKNSKNNKIDMNFGDIDSKNYFSMNIYETVLPDDVYDICIDAGHGGKDTGSNYTYDGTTYYE